jgi:hypothetical protein
MDCRFLLIGLVFILSSCDSGHEHYKTDKDFVLISETESNNKKFKIVEYHFDHGAFDYSRTFWSITPTDNEKLNLGDYLLPDGYKAVSWSTDNEAVIEKWEPYYYKDKEVDLKTGDVFNGVKIRVN